jgi:hypothetical protein
MMTIPPQELVPRGLFKEVNFPLAEVASNGSQWHFWARRFARRHKASAVTTIGLCMIVKNEAGIIARCIANLRPLIDFALIVDTGSTDGTPAIIRDLFSEVGLLGEVIDEPWRDFAYNRTFALEKLREYHDIDYALINDADDQFVFDTGFDVATFKAGLSAGLYDVEIRHGSLRHHRPQILSNRLNFRYRGVLHEFIEGPLEGHSKATVVGFHVQIGEGGARSRDPAKFQCDAAVLERAWSPSKIRSSCPVTHSTWPRVTATGAMPRRRLRHISNARHLASGIKRFSSACSTRLA